MFAKEKQQEPVQEKDQRLSQKDRTDIPTALGKQTHIKDQACSSVSGEEERGVPLKNTDGPQMGTESKEAEESSLLVLKELEDLVREGLHKDKDLKHSKSVKAAGSMTERTNVTRIKI